MPFVTEQGWSTSRLGEYFEQKKADSLIWTPDPDNAPQYRAYFSAAQVIGFGGAAGGGKTDLMVGKALNQHSDSMIMRRVGTELDPVITRVLALWGSKKGYSGGHPAMLTFNRKLRGEIERIISFAAIPNLGDETKFQGHPHDFKGYDEATNFLLKQIRFLATWLRNTRVPNQFREVLMTFNPPQTSEGRWVIDYFAPWLDLNYKGKRAEHGELRYFITVGRGQQQLDIEIAKENALKRHVIIDGAPVLHSEAPPREYREVELITPQSRTFIASRVTDNKYQDAAYLAQLQSLPEPLRSQMLNGDFYAGMNDSEWQVIPTAWIEAAMSRWQPRDRKPEMDSMGVDVARGGNDNSIIARRHDNWYDEPLVYPGKQTPDGPALAGLVVAARRNDAPIHIDVVGVGGSPYDFLNHAKFQIVAVNGGAKEGTEGYRSQGGLQFANWKAYLWWAMREDLDPTNNRGIALPPDPQLKKDLAAPLWKHQGGRIVVESREDIIKRIGRSPDWGSAYVLARLSTPRISQLQQGQQAALGHDPLAVLGLEHGSGGHDPFAH